MISTELLYLVLQVFLTAVFLVVGTLCLLFMEKLIFARTQNRPGPNQSGKHGEAQALADIGKLFSKRGSGGGIGLVSLRNTILPVQLLLPFVFLCLLFFAAQYDSLAQVGLLLLFVILALSVVLDAFYLRSGSPEEEKYEYKRGVTLSLFGLTILVLSLSVVVLGSGSFSQAAEKGILQIPSIILSSLTGFASIFYVLGAHPVGVSSARIIGEREQYAYQLYKKIWIFVLAAFWVFLFTGAFEDALGFSFYCLRLLAILFVFTVLQASMPKIRNSDALVLGIRYLLPFTLLVLFFQILWMGCVAA